MKSTFQLGRIAGVDVGVNASLLFIALLISWSLAAEILPESVPDYTGAAYFVAGVFAAALFFASVLAHELGHSVVARRNGLTVKGITLFFLGGVARLDGDPPTPGALFRLAAAGPAVSILLGVAFLGLWWLSSQLQALALLTGVLGWLGGINIVLAVFNMIPAAPLDGGRVLASMLWALRHDREAGAIGAGRVGDVLGWVMIGGGLVLTVLVSLTGLWYVLLGMFVRQAARAEISLARNRRLWGDRTVRDVLRATQAASSVWSPVGTANTDGGPWGPAGGSEPSPWAQAPVPPAQMLPKVRPEQRIAEVVTIYPKVPAFHVFDDEGRSLGVVRRADFDAPDVPTVLDGDTLG